MILQALYEYAQFEGLADDLDFQPARVARWVILDRDGTLRGIIDKREFPESEGKKKVQPLAPSLSVPTRCGRTSGVAADFLVDNAQYVFGISTPDKPVPENKQNRLRSCLLSFIEQVKACEAATQDDGAAAVHAFQQRLVEGQTTVEPEEDWKSNDFFAFALADEPDTPIHLRPAVVEYWKAQRTTQADSGQGSRRCLVTGERMNEAVLVPQLKKVPGGSSSGISLVSFNSAAFESYRWSKNENAPISRKAAESCAKALNRLLDPAYPDPSQHGVTLPARRYKLTEDTVVVFWSPEAAGQDACDWLPNLLEPSADPGQVREVYHAIWRGHAPTMTNPAAFYALTLTGTQGRAIVRDWFESTVGTVLEHVAEYFGDISIVRNTPPPKERGHPPSIPLHVLLRGLAVRGDASRLPPNLASELFHAALAGRPFPRQILLRAIERAQAEASRREWKDLERRDARAALIKAYLNRQRRANAHAARHYPEVTPDMDPTNTHPGYLLGRLLAVLERLQGQALGDINATVVDRYFKRAVATPRTVFAHLLKLRQSHDRKLRRDKPGYNIFIQRRIDDLLSKLPPSEGIPRTLDLEGQGLFLLGYHHERHWLWMNKEDRAAWAKAHGITTADITELEAATDQA